MEQNTLKNMKFGKEKLKTIWFYYKKHIIVGVLVLAAVIGLTAQCAGKEEADLYIYYAGPVYFSSGAQGELCDAFERVLPEELTLSVGMITTPIASSAENILISDSENEKEEDGDRKEEIGGVYNGSYNDAKADFEDRLRLSDASICILSPHCYEMATKTEILRPVSELCEELPEGSMADGYGVKLSALTAFQNDPLFKKFPDNAVLCLKVKTIMQTTKEYTCSEEIFSAWISG